MLKLLPLLALAAVGIVGGCTAAQLDKFDTAFTGHPASGQSQPPTSSSIIGRTQQAQQVTGGIAAATAGTPVGGYAAIGTAAFTGLLFAERGIVWLGSLIGLIVGNFKGSPSASTVASGGGASSGGTPSSGSSGSGSGGTTTGGPPTMKAA